MSEVRINEADTSWDASGLKGREKNPWEKDLEESVTKEGSRSRQVPQKCTCEEDPLSW